MSREYYNSLIGMFLSVDYKTNDGVLRRAKGVLEAVEDGKLFLTGKYRKFILDSKQIINIAGKPNNERNI